MVNPEIDNHLNQDPKLLSTVDTSIPYVPNQDKYTVTDIRYWTDPPMDTPLPSTVGSIPWIGYPVSREPHVRKAALAFLLAVAEEYDISRSETNDDGDPTPLAKAMKELEDALGT